MSDLSTSDVKSDGQKTNRVVDVINPSGSGQFVLVCEHASNIVPDHLKGLGLSDDTLQTHIAWDPGALSVALAMSDRLDAPLVAQNVSRLVYDCNRPPDVRTAIPETSEIFTIPGNTNLSKVDRQARIDQVYIPFRERLASCLDRQCEKVGSPIIVTVHSFTPVYFGETRDTEIGILHDSDSRLADAMLRAGQHNKQFKFSRNQPYGPGDGVTHTLKEHGQSRNLLNVMIEVRNDLVAHSNQQQSMADLLCDTLLSALDGMANGVMTRSAKVAHS